MSVFVCFGSLFGACQLALFAETFLQRFRQLDLPLVRLYRLLCLPLDFVLLDEPSGEGPFIFTSSLSLHWVRLPLRSFTSIAAVGWECDPNISKISTFW